MRFANPNFLLLVFLLPVVVLALYLRSRRILALKRRYADENLAQRLSAGQSAVRRVVAALLLLSGLLLAIIAGARPQWGFEDRQLVSTGVDILIAVDVSRSMLAEDYKPNRLARAKELLQNLIWALKGDRVGIIAFAGEAAIVCPLTTDYAMARAALEGLETSSVAKPGTDIGRTIDVALGAFELAARGDKVLVLLTDGEDHGGQALALAERAARAGVRIFCVGIGTTEGMPIPEGTGYKEDKEGKLITTRLDFETLSRISEITGGAAFKANPTGIAEIQPLLAEIEKLQKAEGQEMVFRVYHERFPWFLGAALFLLGAELFVFDTRRREEAR